MSLVSPNDLQAAAIDEMLCGLNPVTTKDWQLLVNFWAANIAKGLEESACQIIARLFNCPLSHDTITQICEFQLERK